MRCFYDPGEFGINHFLRALQLYNTSSELHHTLRAKLLEVLDVCATQAFGSVGLTTLSHPNPYREGCSRTLVGCFVPLRKGVGRSNPPLLTSRMFSPAALAFC